MRGPDGGLPGLLTILWVLCFLAGLGVAALAGLLVWLVRWAWRAI